MYVIQMHMVHYATSLGDVTQAVSQPEGLVVIAFLFQVNFVYAIMRHQKQTATHDFTSFVIGVFAYL